MNDRENKTDNLVKPMVAAFKITIIIGLGQLFLFLLGISKVLS